MSDRPPGVSPPARPARRWPRVAAGMALGLAGLAAAWWLWGGRQRNPGPEPGPVPADDPRLTFATPYRNVRPDVKYVGDQACVECHRDLAESYHHHPMGRSVAPVGEADPIERYGPAAHNPFAASGLSYEVLRRDGRVVHREWLAGPDGRPVVEAEAEVQFAIGSGARARGYLVNRDGYLFESPVTWFARAGRWDLSPSYELRNQHFSRPVAPGCLFCHCNSADHVPGTANRYRPPIFRGAAIGCERCHGPGELHVARWQAGGPAGGPDDTIVNPARLDHSLREAVCQQCHLQGEERVVARGRDDFDYRPGLPLHLFLVDYVDRRSRRTDTKFVNSVEQMMTSRCYREGREPTRLGCTSCHDPHRLPAPADRAGYYRGRCLQCHADRGCSLPEPARRAATRDDNCVACHMPRTGSEVVHTPVTDHRILRRPADAPAEPGPRSTPGPDDLVPFHGPANPGGDEEESRNRGLAIMGLLGRGPPREIARTYAAAALPLLERAVRRDPGDWPAAEGRADALWLTGRPGEARAGYEAILAARPDDEAALSAAGSVALELDRPDAAQSYFERAVRVNPWRPQHQYSLALSLSRPGAWARAADACRAALRLEPTTERYRGLLIRCYLRDGRPERAQEEYETLRAITAADRRPPLEEWFREERRSAGAMTR